jgi:hypothetical protein
VANLKKQSQFSKEQNDVISVFAKVYGVFIELGRLKNKAKQSQFAGLWPEIRSTP